MSNFQVDFIGIGAPKCGSTWLSRCLVEHPEINFSRCKETSFFLSPEWGEVYDFFRCQDFSMYQEEFNSKKKGIKGEYSVNYLYDQTAALKIKDYFPQVKLLIVLRNPVDLIYSFYWAEKGSYKSGQFPATFAEFLEQRETFRQKGLFFDFIEKGYFYKYLKKYFEIFPQENIHIIIYKDILTDPQAVLRRVYAFLGVDQNFAPASLHRRILESKQVRSVLVTRMYYLLIKMFEKVDWSKKLVYKYYCRDNKVLPILHKVYSFLNKKKEHYPPIDVELRQYLLGIYDEDIKNLEKLIGRDLSFWRKF